jgi:hypothetical protein
MEEEVSSSSCRLEQSRRVLRHSLIGQLQHGGLYIPATKLIDSKLSNAADFYLPAISPIAVRRSLLPPSLVADAHHLHHQELNHQNHEKPAATISTTSRGRPSLHRMQTSLDAGDVNNRNNLRERLQQRKVRRSLTISDVHHDWPSPLANKLLLSRSHTHLDVNNTTTGVSVINSNGNHSISLALDDNDNSRLVSKDLDELASRKPSAKRPEHRRIQIVYQQNKKLALGGGGGGQGTLPDMPPADERCWPSQTEYNSYLKRLDQQTLSGDEKTKQWLLANPVEHMTGLEREKEANRHVMFYEEQLQQP